MDCLTRKGKIATRKAAEAMKMVEGATDWEVKLFPDHTAAIIDGVCVTNSIIERIIEVKVRDIEYRPGKIIFRGKSYQDYLITFAKIVAGKDLSSSLCVPFSLFIYAEKSGNILELPVTDEKGKFLYDFKVKKTKTMKSINGGTAFRENAFLPMEYAIKII